MAVYLDCAFALNAAVDYALCLLTARLAGIPLRRRRYLAAALLGGLYGAAVFLPGMPWLSAWPIQAAVWVLMTLLAYGREDRWLRLTLLFGLLAFLLAGTVLALGGAAPAHVWVTLPLCAALLWLVLRHMTSIQTGLQGKRLPFRLSVGGRIVSGIALLDTGNQLRDPVLGTSVLVLSPEKGRQLLPRELGCLSLQDPTEALEAIRTAAPELKPRLLPYRSVGRSAGMLVVLRADRLELRGRRGPAVSVALSPSPLGEGCDALWGGEGGGTHEASDCIFKIPGGKAVRTRHPLHWGQRHPAPAADAGAGGRAAGTNRGSRGSAGADRA